jgi:thiosulfate/3-mercaptopyruvate sulfurtransferase
MAEYAHPEVLVSTDWVDEHRHDTDRIRIVESDEDVLLYETGHIPEAVKVDWHNDLQHQILRDYVDKNAFADLCQRNGIANDTTVVFYGDKSNWWACYALWVFKLYGHEDCRVMNGGRAKWKAEDRDMTTVKPSYAPAPYTPRDPDRSIRAFRDEVLAHQQAQRPLIDVRSPDEFTGKLLHMPDYPQEGALRGGHIPGAANVPWKRAVDDDATFKSRKELESIYLGEAGLERTDDVVAYCRIGERSSHTWFVLKYLLGFDKVRNYDGSWTEWGNLVGMPIEKGSGQPSPARA